MIEVRQARYFLAVAETLHFGRAAAQLSMSQPPLSQAILQLERQVGATLLDRSNRRVTLTETGRAFADECRLLVAASHRAHDTATRAAQGLAGTLRLGVVASALSEPLIGTLRGFRESHPTVDVCVTEVDTPTGLDGLLDRSLDVALIRPNTPVRGLRIEPWRHDRFVVAFPAEHPVALDPCQAKIDLASVADEPWVWLRRDASPDYHDQLIDTCRQAGFHPRVHHLANSIHTQLAMTAAGLGLALVPNASAVSGGPAIAYRPLTNRADVVELSLVSRASDLEPLIARFLTATRTTVGPS